MGERKMGPIHDPADGLEVWATQVDGAGCAIGFQVGRPLSGEFKRYLSVADARRVAECLIAAADHCDAETARLAGGSVPDSLPADIPAPVDPTDEDTCESGESDCGPVEHWDSEGIPLCARCYDSLTTAGELPPPFPTADGLVVEEAFEERIVAECREDVRRDLESQT